MATVNRMTKARNGVHPQLSLGGPAAESLMERPADWPNEYDPDAEFPEVPFGLGMTVQILWLTPTMAARWLSSDVIHPRQRNTKEMQLASLVEDHLAGRFMLNGEPLVFDWDGFLVDGAHRCRMVVKSDKPALVTVVRNVPPAAYATFDNGSKRKGSDALRADRITDPVCVAAAAALLERYQRGLLGKKNLVVSPALTTEIVAQHPGLVTSVAFAVSMNKFPSRSGLGMAHYVLTSVNRADAEMFFERLKSGAGLTKSDPILTLRDRLYGQKVTSTEIVFLVFKAWNYWRRSKPLKCLKLAEGETLQTPQ